MSYKIHPLCAAFPDLEGSEYESLRDSLKNVGQLEPCWVWKEWLIDGKNRQRALTENKQEITYEDWHPISTDPEAIQRELQDFVMAKNLDGRRHLSVKQRAKIAAEISKKDGDKRHKSQSQAARDLGVSRSSVVRAEKELDGEIVSKDTTPKEPPTPFDAVLAATDWLLSTANPKIQTTALEIEELFGRSKGDFSAGRVMGAMKTVFDQFNQIRGLIAHTRNRHLQRQGK